MTRGETAASQGGALGRLIKNPSHHRWNPRLHLDRVQVMVRDARGQGLPCAVLERMPMQCNDNRIIAQPEARVNEILQARVCGVYFNLLCDLASNLCHPETKQGRSVAEVVRRACGVPPQAGSRLWCGGDASLRPALFGMTSFSSADLGAESLGIQKSETHPGVRRGSLGTGAQNRAGIRMLSPSPGLFHSQARRLAHTALPRVQDSTAWSRGNGQAE